MHVYHFKDETGCWYTCTGTDNLQHIQVDVVLHRCAQLIGFNLTFSVFLQLMRTNIRHIVAYWVDRSYIMCCTGCQSQVIVLLVKWRKDYIKWFSHWPFKNFALIFCWDLSYCHWRLCVICWWIDKGWSPVIDLSASTHLYYLCVGCDVCVNGVGWCNNWISSNRWCHWYWAQHRFSILSSLDRFGLLLLVFVCVSLKSVVYAAACVSVCYIFSFASQINYGWLSL